jgi:hypothetical protein
MIKKSTSPLFFILFLGICLSSNAQIQLAIEFNRNKFIQHEAVDLTLHVINNSGSQLSFGKSKGKIEFLILSEISNWTTKVDPFKKFQEDKTTGKSGFNAAAGLTLGAGETKKVTIRLNKYFPMAKAVKYRIKARLSHPRLNKALETAKFQEIEISKGNILETRTFGVADDKDPKKINSRKYTILGFNVDNNDMYCIKFWDDKWVYSLHRLGPRVQGIRPQHDVDSFSNVHVLIQLEPKVFIHTIYSPEGKEQQEVIYKASFDNVPKLKRDSDLGKITVINGLKAIEGVDYVKQGNTYRMIN